MAGNNWNKGTASYRKGRPISAKGSNVKYADGGAAKNSGRSTKKSAPFGKKRK